MVESSISESSLSELDGAVARAAEPNEEIESPSENENREETSVESPAISVEQNSGPVESSKISRVWQRWPGANRFFCDGRLMGGPYPGAALITGGLILFPGSLFLAFPAADFFDRSPGPSVFIVGIIFLFLSIFFMFLTAFFDPGIIPRRIPAPGAETLDNPFAIKPRYQDHLVHGKTVQLKYCDTCKIYRPPRAVHCGLCDNCVTNFDHQ